MKKIINSIFLISCTSIGAGILALPALTSHNGFIYSSILFITCYIFMTLSAFFLLEINLWFKKNTSIISCINQILGYKWKLLTSLIYILLLYSLISAYIVAYIKWIINDRIYNNIDYILGFTLYISLTILIVYYKSALLNKINNTLSVLLFLTYFIIIYKCLFFAQISNITTLNLNNLNNLLTLAITSFGFGIIIPTLSDFLKKDTKKLYFALLIGSVIPLLAYIFWIAIMLGIFPLTGDFSLKNISSLSQEMIFSIFIKKIIESNTIIYIIKLFAIFSIITSLIGVSTSLKDFLSDERIFKKNNIVIFLAIIIPPILTIIYLKIGFIKIIKVSGILISLLLGIIPTLTIWHGRYKLKIKSKNMIPGKKITLIANFLFFSYVIINDLSTL